VEEEEEAEEEKEEFALPAEKMNAAAG